MKLLFDSSLLGIGFRNQTISGLMRAAENLLSGIVGIDEVGVTLCGSLSFDVWQNCRKYLKRNPALGSLSFVRQEMNRNQFYHPLSSRVSAMEKTWPQCHGLVNNLLRILFEINFKPLSFANLDGMDIYHSPYHELPGIVKRARHVKKFLTVHDIIPVLHPELFGIEKNFSVSDFHREFNLLKALKGIDEETWITCPSTSTRDDLCNYLDDKMDCRKIFVTPWAASTLFHRCQDSQVITSMKRKYGLPEGPYVLCLSTLEPRKNIEHVIRCFAQLLEQESLPDLSLVLAGSLGWDYEPIFGEIDKFTRFRDRIIFTGYVADQDIAPLYSDALAFVYLSLYEGFGLPPLEAMQCGAPVIVSKTSSLPEVVGDAGVTLDPLDGDGLCQSISTLYHDASLRKKLSVKSIERARQFSWSKCARQTVGAYREALA